MAEGKDSGWFTLARQPQEPLSPGAPTLSGDALARWKRNFTPLLKHLRRRDVVLALSGGGMAMPAHISLIRVLELLGVSPTRIYGTSAGAVIGGLRAAGMSTDEIESAMLDIRSANELFGFAARYPALRLLTGAIKRSIVGRTFKEAGIYDLERIEGQVESILLKYVGRVPKMSELTTPFHCIAVDIGTGDATGTPVRKVVFSAETTPDVPVTDAIGASMSIPGVITPKRIGERYYIDGAAVEHLPILTARSDWLRRRRRFPPGRLAIIASDLGYVGESRPEAELADPVDLIVFSRRLQERAITSYNILLCHRPRRGSSVILVRPRSVHVALYEIDKIRRCLRSAYEDMVEQLSGDGFMDETAASIGRASESMGLPGERETERRL